MSDEKDTDLHVGFEEHEPFDIATPEKNLLKAVLLSAIADLKKPGEVRRKATEFFLNKEESYLFSFVAICDHLSVDPNKILVVTGLKKPRNDQFQTPQQQPENVEIDLLNDPTQVSKN